MWKRVYGLLLAWVVFGTTLAAPPAVAQIEGIEAKSVVLMDSATGSVLYEENAHEALPPASVTKIMTMLLIMEALENGQISEDTIVVASERAKSMGGSTIFLDTNESMSVHDLLKGIAVASGNDACVAMAEHLCGSVEAFVEKMNARAAELGMEHTHFVNCNGLDAEGHVTSAYDIALMSRELLRHRKILEFTSIWMDSLRDGAFQLANTNKMVRFYSGANGLKTGSTNAALCCVSATAKRDDLELIAVVMGSPTSKQRFAAASKLLDYGFANYAMVTYGDDSAALGEVAIEKGRRSTVGLEVETPIHVLVNKADRARVELVLSTPDAVRAPVKKGQILGEMSVVLDGNTLASGKVVAQSGVARLTPVTYFGRLFRGFLTIP